MKRECTRGKSACHGSRNGYTVLKTETHISHQAHAAGLHVHQLRPGQKIPIQARWQHAPRLTDEQADTLDLRQWAFAWTTC